MSRASLEQQIQSPGIGHHFNHGTGSSLFAEILLCVGQGGRETLGVGFTDVQNQPCRGAWCCLTGEHLFQQGGGSIAQHAHAETQGEYQQ